MRPSCGHRSKPFAAPAKDATIEAELDCDGNLRYEDTQRTIAAISSCLAHDGRTMLPLVDRVNFLPRLKESNETRMSCAWALLERLER